MEDNVTGIIMICFGAMCLLLRKKFATSTVNFQNKTFGFNYGKKEESANKFLFVIAGIVFVSAGVLVILGRFSLK